MNINLKRTNDAGDVASRESSDSNSVPVLLRLPDLGVKLDETSNPSDIKTPLSETDSSDSTSASHADHDNSTHADREDSSTDSRGRSKSLGVPVLVGLLFIGLTIIGVLFVTDPNIHGKPSDNVKSTSTEESGEAADSFDGETESLAEHGGDNSNDVDASISGPPNLFAEDSPADEPPAFETPEAESPSIRSAKRDARGAATEGTYPRTDPSTYIYPSDSDSVEGDEAKRGDRSDKQPGMATLRGTIEPPPQRDRARR